MMVAVSLAPVQPSGCPNAIAPPLGLTFSGSRPASLMTPRACAAKASFKLDHVDVSQLQPRHLQCFRNREDRAQSHFFWFVTGGGK